MPKRSWIGNLAARMHQELAQKLPQIEDLQDICTRK